MKIDKASIMISLMVIISVLISIIYFMVASDTLDEIIRDENKNSISGQTDDALIDEEKASHDIVEENLYDDINFQKITENVQTAEGISLDFKEGYKIFIKNEFKDISEFVFNDISAIYAHLSIEKSEKVNSTNGNYYVEFIGNGRIWPDVLDDFHWVSGNPPTFILNDAILMKYRESYNFHSEHKGLSKDLEYFIDSLNQKNDNYSFDFIDVSRDTEYNSDETINENALFLKPSVLSYNSGNDLGSEYTAIGAYLEEEKGVDYSQRIVYLYRDGKWKIIIN